MDPSSISQPRSNFWLLMLVAVVIMAGVVVGIVVYGGDGGSSDGQPPTTGDAGATQGSTPTSTGDAGADNSAGSGEGATGADDGGPSESLDSVVAELSADTERLRGLPFLDPVDVTLLDDEAFKARLQADFDDDLDADQLVEVERVWQALGMIEPDVSLEAVLRSALEQGVLGFYDSETDELVVRGAELDPYVRSTLVHELVHALDDQHFDLERADLMDGDDTEAQLGFIGLVEGTASWVEDRWVAELDPSELAELRRAEARFGSTIDYGAFPEALLVDLSLPYVLGPALVGELAQLGGIDQIDAAYLAPPTNGEQLFDAQAYLDLDPAVTIDVPPADGPVISVGVMGASGLYEALLTHAPAEAALVATRWDGDRYVLWQDGDNDRWCTRVDVIGDDADATDVVFEALDLLAGRHGDASAERVGDLVRLTACG